MKILKAKHLGMCFGVRDAIKLALTEANQQPLTVLGDLVHNDTVLAELRQKGIKIVNEASDARTSRLMITAHGASSAAIARARDAGFSVSEATCPLVHVAHRALANLVQQGYHPVVIGKRGHVEVRGLIGDYAECDVILSEKDVQEMENRTRFGVVAQTTQPVERVRWLVAKLRERFPGSEIRFIDTVCQPTKQRQNAAAEIACQSDAVVVIGGAHSNNTHELVQTCLRYCSRVFHVQSVDDLAPSWFEGMSNVGLTAGTSTPDSVIHEVEDWLSRLAPPQPAAAPRVLGTRRETATHLEVA
jgi:4-hydroxy-3-methylbut-2-enyl diphosphate reductase